jgi:hypothetical protein
MKKPGQQAELKKGVNIQHNAQSLDLAGFRENKVSGFYYYYQAYVINKGIVRPVDFPESYYPDYNCENYTQA